MQDKDITILIVEDDEDLSSIIKDYLVNEGYQVHQVFNGAEAVSVAKSLNPVLIILDIMLPGLSGIEACKQIRSFSYCPILIISAKSSDSDKLLTLGVGADDYLTKPFSFVEMIGRVKSHIRRFTSFDSSNTTTVPTLSFGDLTITPSSYTATISGREIPLTTKEFNLLYFLCSHPEQVFTKSQLLNAVWGYDSFLDENTVTVYIGRLRDKIFRNNENYIKTVWGVGYKFQKK